MGDASLKTGDRLIVYNKDFHRFSKTTGIDLRGYNEVFLIIELGERIYTHIYSIRGFGKKFILNTDWMKEDDSIRRLSRLEAALWG